MPRRGFGYGSKITAGRFNPREVSHIEVIVESNGQLVLNFNKN